VTYIQEQTAGEIIRNTVDIYRRHFLTIVIIFLVPTVPFVVVRNIFEVHGNSTMVLLLSVVETAAAMFTMGALTLAVSDVCLANRPSFTRSYAALGRVLGRYTLAFTLVWLLYIVGVLLFVIPAIYIAIVTMFVLPIVMLERKGGLEAVKRSRQLAKGYFWRLLGVVLLMFIIYFVFIFLISVVFGFIFGMAVDFEHLEQGQIFVFNFCADLIAALATPPLVIYPILLYYDIRVRKEQYDTAALSQELLT